MENRSASSRDVTPVGTRIVLAGPSAATTSVSMRSPTIVVLSECAPSELSAERIIRGFGFPTK